MLFVAVIRKSKFGDVIPNLTLIYFVNKTEKIDIPAKAPDVDETNETTDNSVVYHLFT